jgi:hypothetical protein
LISDRLRNVEKTLAPRNVASVMEALCLATISSSRVGPVPFFGLPVLPESAAF